MAVPDDPALESLGVTLHQRLLNGDVTASAEIAEAYFPGLLAYMRTRYPQIDDPHLSETAAEDAFMNYLERPQQYNPEKATLEAYLRRAASGDLKNELTKRDRERRAQGGERVVELDAPGTEYQVEDTDGLSVEEEVEILLSPLWSRLKVLVPDPVDQEMVRLMMDNVRDSGVFAQLLGITDLSLEEQGHEVKRHKDRLKKWLKRNLRLKEEDDD